MSDEKRNIVGIVQARMGSSRLPQKILLEVKGKPLLQHMVERLLQSKYLDKIVIATTINTLDDIIEKFAIEKGYYFYRGSEHDVLDRFYQTAKKFNATVIVRFCSDCPIIDFHYVDKIIKTFLENEKKISLVCNKMPFTFPDGYDTEVCSFATLERLWNEVTEIGDREHVFPYLYCNNDIFQIINVEYEKGNLFNSHRFTLDYEEDLECIKHVINNLYDSNHFFTLEDVLRLVNGKPEILKINAMHLPDTSVRRAIDSGHSPLDNRIK